MDVLNHYVFVKYVMLGLAFFKFDFIIIIIVIVISIKTYMIDIIKKKYEKLTIELTDYCH